MSQLTDALRFEGWRGGQFWEAIKKDPQRLLTGAFDPIGTGIYNKVTGDNLEPLGNQLGAPTEDQYAKAEAHGINTGGARGMNDIAQVVAAIYGGQALGAAAGGGSGAGVTSGIETTPQATGFGVGQGGAAGYNGGLGGGMSGGYGAGAGAAGGSDWAQYARLAGSAANHPTPASPAFGAPPKAGAPQPFRDTFKEKQDQQKADRRKRLAQMLMRAR